LITTQSSRQRSRRPGRRSNDRVAARPPDDVAEEEEAHNLFSRDERITSASVAMKSMRMSWGSCGTRGELLAREGDADGKHGMSAFSTAAMARSKWPCRSRCGRRGGRRRRAGR
jgi:hypothetical protein